MKILYVTPWQPSLKSGGGRHTYANARSLCLYPDATVDYIGPAITEDLPDLPRTAFRRSISRNFTMRDKLCAAFRTASTSVVSLFGDFMRSYDVRDYDLAFVESTRCGFVFSNLDAKTRTICCVHNVEADYLRFNGIGASRLAARNIRRSEKTTLDKCRMFLVMHTADLQRLREVYAIDNEERFLLHPACSTTPKMDCIPFEKRDRQLIFMGSLDSKFNEIGLREFLASCWPELKGAGFTLLVAGSNPSADLVEFISCQPDVRLVANPPELEPLLRNSRILLLPDITGTGMKLRVAEAMSLGVPVVGTRFGLRGYEDASHFGEQVESVSEMKDAVLRLISDPSRLHACADEARRIWDSKYSIDVFTARLHHYLSLIPNREEAHS